ncbi:MAG: peptidoglycan-associated lipoprotein Pal [Arsenophonus sp.]
MKLNKMLKCLVLILSILIITACNSKKRNEKIIPEKNVINVKGRDVNVIDKNPKIITDQLTQKKIQKFQSNNVVYFGFDKYDITKNYIQILDQYADFLRKNPYIYITVEGHTDARGTPEYNIALGERRANVVKIYLQSKGVNDEQISIVSYGKEKPAVIGHYENAYSKNRRSVLVIIREPNEQ